MHAGKFTLGFDEEAASVWWERFRHNRADNAVWEMVDRKGSRLDDIEGKDAGAFINLTDLETGAIHNPGKAGGEERVLESALTLTSGEKLPVNVRLNKINYKGEDYNCIYLHDLTVKKKRDARLKLSAAALDFAADCILWLDVDLRVNYINGTLLSLLGMEREEITGAKYSKVFPQLERKSITAEQVLDIRVVDRSGEAHTLNLNVSKIVENTQQFYMLVGRDVSKQNERQQSLEAAYEEIRQLKDNLEDENITLREEVGSDYNVNNITFRPRERSLHRCRGPQTRPI